MMLFEPQHLLGMLQQHLRWYPLMELRDIYKLLFQSVMGAEHLIHSAEEYSLYLQTEFEHLLPDPLGRLLEPIRPDQSLLRVNLRPYKSYQRCVDGLTPALLQTAGLFTGNPAVLRTTWKEFIHLCERGELADFDINEIQQFTSWLEGLKYPAIHHSEVYRREYQPAYRLIAAQFIHQLGLDNAS